MKFIIFEGKRPLVEVDQLPNLSHLSFFIKWTQFFIKSTKMGVFYQHEYIDITKKRDPWQICKKNHTFGTENTSACEKHLT